MASQPTRKSSNVIEKIVDICWQFRVTFLFASVYMIANSVYVVALGQRLADTATYPGNVLAFATAPINILENTASAPGLFAYGLVANFGFVLLYLFIAEMLSREYKPIISVEYALLISIASTYAVSAMIWAHYGVPAIGTSIIGVSMAMYIVGLCVWAMFVRAVRTIVFSMPLDIRLYLIEATLTTAILVLVMGTAVVGNPAVVNHEAGAILFVFGVWCFISWKMFLHRDRGMVYSEIP